MRQVSAGLLLIFAVTACAPDADHSVESPGTKHEWSILQVAEAQTRSSGRPTAPGTVKRLDDRDLLAVKNADGTSNIWVMLWPKSSPYYKQMPEGAYVVPREILAAVERSGKASPTVLGVLASHNGQMKANHAFENDALRASLARAPQRGRYASINEVLDIYTPAEYSSQMFTVVETSAFQKQWPLYWTEEERGEFAAYIAEFPNSGDVVPQSGGIRKVRWRRAGTGKSGGVRVVYFTRTVEEEIVLLLIYAKSKTDNITGTKLKEIRRVIEN